MRDHIKNIFLFMALPFLLILPPAAVCGSDTSGPRSACGPGTIWSPSLGECVALVVCSEGTVNVNNICIPASKPAQIEIISTNLPNGNTDSLYEASLVAEIENPKSSKKRSPLTENWEVIDGFLPGGLSLDTQTGVISGTPSSGPGTFVFTVRVIGGPPFWLTDEQELSIQIDGIEGDVSAQSLIPDTGQTICFDANAPLSACPNPGEPFYGQDAQYTFAMTLESNEPGIVRDGVNGLEWQATDDATQYNWYEASGTLDDDYNPDGTDVCASLNLGGYPDWRLPTRRELISIINYGHENTLPAIDTDFFSTTSSYYWTATSVADSPGYSWNIDFTDGSVLYGLPPSLDIGYVRCVRGTPLAEVHNFVDNNDGTVTDIDTGLIWQQGDAGFPMDWQEALAYCENLDFAGYDDWKLPDVKELESVVDVTRALPSIDNETYFPSALSSGYWSSTSDMIPPNGGWEVDFGFGEIIWTDGKDEVYTNFVRCVRRP
jgi:hypothetical protein